MFFKDSDFAEVDEEIEQALRARSMASAPSAIKSALIAPPATPSPQTPVEPCLAAAREPFAVHQENAHSVGSELSPISTADALLVPRNEQGSITRTISYWVCGHVATIFVLFCGLVGPEMTLQITPFVTYAVALILSAIPTLNAEPFRLGSAAAVPWVIVTIPNVSLFVVAGLATIFLIEVVLDFHLWKRSRSR